MSAHAFTLTPDLESFRDEVGSLARLELLPLEGLSSEGAINHRLLRKLGDVGLLGALFPPEAIDASPEDRARGRSGVSAMKLCLMREGMATVCTEAETALALQGLGAYPLLQAGSQELVQQWIPGVAAGDVVASFALTEPDCGSDVAQLNCKAVACEGGWKISGHKIFISNAPHADFYTVFARTTQDAGAKGVTAFFVPGDAEGLTGEHQPMISEHPIGRLYFDEVFVPEAHLLGEVDRGFQVAMRTLDLFRPSVGAFAVGMAEAALQLAIHRSAEREAFGRKIRDFQGISFKLADMATRTEAARLLVYRAAAAFDAGVERNTRNAAMAKLFATETAQFVVDEAVQIFGGRALERGHLLEHLYREVRAPRIYEGSSEIQRVIISRELQREVEGHS